MQSFNILILGDFGVITYFEFNNPTRSIDQTETNNNMAEGYKDFVAGTVAGFCGKLLDYPFDTVKVCDF